MPTPDAVRRLYCDLTADEIHARVAESWDLAAPLPTPGPWLCCPCCSATELQARFWRFHLREGGRIPWRCDVSFKCCRCSLVFTFGVALDEATFARHVPNGHRKSFDHGHARSLFGGSE